MEVFFSKPVYRGADFFGKSDYPKSPGIALDCGDAVILVSGATVGDVPELSDAEIQHEVCRSSFYYPGYIQMVPPPALDELQPSDEELDLLIETMDTFKEDAEYSLQPPLSPVLEFAK